VSISAGLTLAAWMAVPATGSRKGNAMDCLERQETLLAVSGASRGPFIYYYKGGGI
jgi:hypothetical protein